MSAKKPCRLLTRVKRNGCRRHPVHPTCHAQEYVPTGMLLLLLLETQTDAPKKLLAAYAAAFAAARLSHAYALSNTYTPNVSD